MFVGLGRSESPEAGAEDSEHQGDVLVDYARPVSYHRQADQAISHLDRLAASLRQRTYTSPGLNTHILLDALACKSITQLSVTDPPNTPPIQQHGGCPLPFFYFL